MILIGDHNQLPPVVKNEAFRRFGRLDQSLFARFVRSLFFFSSRLSNNNNNNDPLTYYRYDSEHLPSNSIDKDDRDHAFQHCTDGDTNVWVISTML